LFLQRARVKRMVEFFRRECGAGAFVGHTGAVWGRVGGGGGVYGATS
jgi:hypothetical protein